MLEDNTFRMMMFIGAIIIVAGLIGLVVANYDEFVVLLDNFFSIKLQKY